MIANPRCFESKTTLGVTNVLPDEAKGYIKYSNSNPVLDIKQIISLHTKHNTGIVNLTKRTGIVCDFFISNLLENFKYNNKHNA
jgi:hypothetical protein